MLALAQAAEWLKTKKSKTQHLKCLDTFEMVLLASQTLDICMHNVQTKSYLHVAYLPDRRDDKLSMIWLTETSQFVCIDDLLIKGAQQTPSWQ